MLSGKMKGCYCLIIYLNDEKRIQIGKKMGKTEKSAIWIDCDKISAYDFYQGIYQTPDACVEMMYALFTDIPMAFPLGMRPFFGESFSFLSFFSFGSTVQHAELP